jgi:hypothetical protein
VRKGARVGRGRAPDSRAAESSRGGTRRICDVGWVVRAVEHLRLVMAEVQVATVRSQVVLSLRDDFEKYSIFKPRPFNEKTLGQVFDQVIAWGGALRKLREQRV